MSGLMYIMTNFDHKLPLLYELNISHSYSRQRPMNTTIAVRLCMCTSLCLSRLRYTVLRAPSNTRVMFAGISTCATPPWPARGAPCRECSSAWRGSPSSPPSTSCPDSSTRCTSLSRSPGADRMPSQCVRWALITENTKVDVVGCNLKG